MNSQYSNEALVHYLQITKGLYRSLFTGSLAFAAAIILLTIALALLNRRLHMKKAYVLSGSRLPHYIFMVFFSFMLLWAGIDGRTWTGLMLATVIYGLYSLYGLFKGRRSALISCFAILPVCVFLINTVNVDAVAADTEFIKATDPLSMLAVYSASDYLVMKTFVMLIAVCAVIIYYAGYYTQARYLIFADNRIKTAHIDRCSCGYVLINGYDFCPGCGRELDGRGSRFSFDCADPKKYCEKCGTRLKDGSCGLCEPETFISVMKDKASGKIKAGAFAGVILLLILFPVLTNDFYKKVMVDASAINAYIDAVMACSTDSEQSPAAADIEAYRTAADALIRSDERIFDVNVRSLNYADLYFYLTYCEESYRRICIVDAISSCIETGDMTHFGEYASAFDATIKKQNEFTDSRLSFLGLQTENNLMTSAVNMLTDTLRFYTSGLSLTIEALILVLIAALICGTALYKAPAPADDFKHLELIDELPVKEKTHITKFDFIVAAIYLVVILAATLLFGPKDDPTISYTDQVKNCLYTQAYDIVSLSDPDIEQLRALCAAQLEGIEVLKGLEGDDDVIKGVVDEFLPGLETVLTAVTEHPADEATVQLLIGYEIAAMKIASGTYIKEAFDGLSGLVE